MTFRFPLSVVVLFVLLQATVAEAQQRVPLPKQAAKAETDVEPRHWCATIEYMYSHEGDAALRRFHEARANGTLPRLAKRQESYRVGALQTFYIITDSAWVAGEFELKATGTYFNLWLRTDDPNQPAVTGAQIEAVRAALEESTPSGSLYPDKGVVEIDKLVFGDWPTYPDGTDGVIDILVYTQRPGVAGFVSPVDIDPFAEPGQGNQAEVLHIWVDGFFTTSNVRIESVIAHELQHLIHQNYDVREIAFVNEGLSEYAQLLLGYTAAVPIYLLVSPPEYNIPLFAWRTGDEGVASGLDYTRASTWHGYLGDQLGPEITGAFTRHPQIGLEGYKAVLAEQNSQKTIDQLIVDFHTAVKVNDLSVDERFGIKDPVRTSQIDIVLPDNRRFDGARRTTGNLDSLLIQPGGTEYVEWRNVENLEFTFDVKAGEDLIEARRQHARLRIIAEPLAGDIQILDFMPSPDPNLVAGSFKRVTLVAANVRPEVVQLPAYLHSQWTSNTELQVVSYAYGQDIPYYNDIDGALAFSMAAESDAAIAVRFPVPPGGQLNDADLGIFHFNEFGVGPVNAPRDYLFTMWNNAGGSPGEIIYSELYENLNPAQLVSVVAYRWQTFEFSPPLSKRLVLPDTVYIGAREVGADDNYMIIWPARVDPRGFPDFRPVDTGFIGGADEEGNRIWVHSWDVTFEGGEEGDLPLRSTALPVRARFVVDPTTIDVEETPELPAEIVLAQNYPNPFNPSTRIEFAVPQSEHVELKVFDMTGREVMTLVDGLKAAGTYTVTFSGETWASGMYIYRLKAGDEQFVRRMVLLK